MDFWPIRKFIWNQINRKNLKLKPPMSQTFNLNSECMSDLILNPWVGIIWVISSSESLFSIVVFPALSKPRTNILASLSLLFNFLCFKNKNKEFQLYKYFLTLINLIIPWFIWIVYLNNGMIISKSPPKNWKVEIQILRILNS